MTFVLNNIRSAWNVGSIFRTADAVGADIVLIGYTPQPVGKTEALVKKTAIGAEKTVAWQHFTHEQEAIRHLTDYIHIGIEITERSTDIYTFLQDNTITPQHKQSACYWFGNEIHGLSASICNQCTAVVHLPMLGMKESLNVANTVCTVGYLVLGISHRKSV